MNKTYKSQPGFTIIEVVLVLAIAALIFLMVFVALPALQSSQRDTARKNDASIVTTAVTDYTSAYRKPLTGASSEQNNLRGYVKDLDQYNDGAAVIVKGGGADTDKPPADQIWVHPNSKCDGPNAGRSANARQASVRLLLENNNAYCVDASS